MTTFSRPEDGFFIRYTPAAQTTKEAICARSDVLCRRIEGIVDRIRLVGHLEGHPLVEEEPFLNRVMSDGENGDLASVLYDIMGDSATIRGMSCWPS